MPDNPNYDPRRARLARKARRAARHYKKKEKKKKDWALHGPGNPHAFQGEYCEEDYWDEEAPRRRKSR